ncbi:hypothetical protein LC608_32695 [Nostoc sp. XA010]|uniref:hypothetical protein n=1 Tax=Nostoc sp. XA010 TaxID=2780407 RepID=UPI001E31696C|nr:hypothetical protein [Nostoc sp. XA010]MCC5661623.1 hypothetical protein [Nostoc sp. XA010]
MKDVADRIRERTKIPNPYHVGEVRLGAFIEESVQLPIIIVTAMDDERHGVNALKLELLIHLRINLKIKI